MKYLGSSIVWILISVVLTACGSQPIIKQDPALEAQQKGYVYAAYPLRGTIGVRELNTNQKYQLINNESHINGWGANGVWLPPGEYTVDSWMGIELEEYSPFSVEKGKITDLGSFIPLSVGNYEFVLLPYRHSELDEIGDTVFKNLAPYVQTKKVTRWSMSNPPKPSKDEFQGTGLGLIADLLTAYERKLNNPGLNELLRKASTNEEFYSLAKKGTPPLEYEPAFDEDGNLYYGADLGQVRVRYAEGTWGSIDSGRIVPVTAVEWADGQLVIGFDDGLISVLDRAGSRKDLANTNKYSVIDIDRTNDGWVVASAKYRNSKLEEAVVYSSSGHLPQELIESQRFTPKNTHFIPKPNGEVAGGTYFFSIFPGLNALDTKSLTWEKVILPGDIHSFHVSGSTVVAFKSQGVFSKVYLSHDVGNSWEEIDRPPYHIWNVNFTEGEGGTAARSKAKTFSVEQEFYQYSPDQKKWTYLYSAPQGCNRAPLLDAKKDSRFCVTANGDILNYEDGEWRVEFSTN